MIQLHHLNNSRSQRIIWALEELDLPYEIVPYARDSKTYLAPLSLKDVHPLGKSPILVDDNVGSNKVLAESGAIIDYLVYAYGEAFLPERGTDQYLQYNYWMHYAEGSLMPFLVMTLVFEKIKTNPMPFFIKPIVSRVVKETFRRFITPNIDMHLAYIEQHLKANQWFAGDELTGADFQMSFPLEAGLSSQLVNENEHPSIVKYIKKFQARPAYKRALNAGGDYDYA